MRLMPLFEAGPFPHTPPKRLGFDFISKDDVVPLVGDELETPLEHIVWTVVGRRWTMNGDLELMVQKTIGGTHG